MPSVSLLKETSKLTKIFVLDRSQNPLRYKEVFKSPLLQSVAFEKWAKLHDEELVNTMASEHSADIVATIADEAGFGNLGDHGGFQEKVQRIPMIIAGPHFKKAQSPKALRLRDLARMISESFELAPGPENK